MGCRLTEAFSPALQTSTLAAKLPSILNAVATEMAAGTLSGFNILFLPCRCVCLL